MNSENESNIFPELYPRVKPALSIYEKVVQNFFYGVPASQSREGERQSSSSPQVFGIIYSVTWITVLFNKLLWDLAA